MCLMWTGVGNDDEDGDNEEDGVEGIGRRRVRLPDADDGEKAGGYIRVFIRGQSDVKCEGPESARPSFARADSPRQTPRTVAAPAFISRRALQPQTGEHTERAQCTLHLLQATARTATGHAARMLLNDLDEPRQRPRCSPSPSLLPPHCGTESLLFPRKHNVSICDRLLFAITPYAALLA